MAKFETTIKGDFNHILPALHDAIMNSAMSVEWIDETVFERADLRVVVRVYDKYYMRSSNRASLTLTLVGYGNEPIKVSAVGAGGGNGWFLNFSWGAEEDFISVVANVIKQLES